MAAKLHYFCGRGRGETIRIMLAVVGIEFTEQHVQTKDDYEKLKADGRLLFQQVPMLEVDGKMYTQAGAILRMLARKANMFGQNDEEANRIDELFEGAKDFQAGYIPMLFRPEEDVKEELMRKLLPRHLPIFDKLLKDNGDCGFLVGNAVSMADVQLLEALLSTEDYFGMDAFAQYDSIKKFYNAMKSLDSIKNYLSYPLRKPKNTTEYCSTVMKALF